MQVTNAVLSHLPLHVPDFTLYLFSIKLNARSETLSLYVKRFSSPLFLLETKPKRNIHVRKYVRVTARLKLLKNMPILVMETSTWNLINKSDRNIWVRATNILCGRCQSNLIVFNCWTRQNPLRIGTRRRRVDKATNILNSCFNPLNNTLFGIYLVLDTSKNFIKIGRIVTEKLRLY